MTSDLTTPAGVGVPSIEDLARDLGPAIYRLALSIVQDRALAEDVVQETLVKAWQHLDGYRGEAPIRNWVLRIAHNTAISVLRKRREAPSDPSVLPETGESRPTADLARDLEGRSAVDQLWAALDTLDPTTRSIVVLREVEGLTYEEICDALGLALPTVKTRLFRGRRQLAELLRAWR